MFTGRITKDYCLKNNIDIIREFSVEVFDFKMRKISNERLVYKIDITEQDYKQVIIEDLRNKKFVNRLRYFKVKLNGRYITMLDLNLRPKDSILRSIILSDNHVYA